MIKVGGKWVSNRCLFDDMNSCERHSPSAEIYEPHVRLIKLRECAELAKDLAKKLGDQQAINKANKFYDEAFGE